MSAVWGKLDFATVVAPSFRNRGDEKINYNRGKHFSKKYVHIAISKTALSQLRIKS